jgi:hypothetical protein
MKNLLENLNVNVGREDILSQQLRTGVCMKLVVMMELEQ